MEKIKIGRIVNAVALRGEVKVYHYSDYKERFEEFDTIIADDKEYKIEKVRFQQNMVILKLSGVDDRNAAEALKNTDVYITEADLRELPEDTFYIKDLVGLNIVEIETDKPIGKLKDVLQNSAQDVYLIELLSGGTGMIPAVSEFIKEINMEEGFIKVKLIEGMID
ncbi:16S rRNA processing protein RimM [Clostridiales Family XIII bacterium PM5-7]